MGATPVPLPIGVFAVPGMHDMGATPVPLPIGVFAVTGAEDVWASALMKGAPVVSSGAGYVM